MWFCLQAFNQKLLLSNFHFPKVRYMPLHISLLIPVWLSSPIQIMQLHIKTNFSPASCNLWNLWVSQWCIWGSELLECEAGLVIPDAAGERSAVIVEEKESRKNGQNWDTENHQPSDMASHTKRSAFFVITSSLLKLKVKITLEQATKPQSGSRGITLLFL